MKKETKKEILELKKYLFWLFEESGWSGVLNTLGQRSKEECIGSILNSVEQTIDKVVKVERETLNKDIQKINK